jgi:hypothetical protein
MHQHHRKNTYDQSEEGHVILLAHTVVEPLAVMVKLIYATIAETTVLGFFGDMGVTDSADEWILAEVEAHQFTST